MLFGFMGSRFGRMGGIATASAAASTSPQVSAFLARTSGLDATHVAAYTALIDGLVADGIWTKLDVLQVYATQDATTALLNLISTSYPATTSGSPTFTADGGYTTASGKYVDTGFPFNAGGNYVQNSACIFLWSGSNVAATATNKALASNFAFSGNTMLQPRNASDQMLIQVNDTSTIGTPANTDGSGFYCANRTSSTLKQAWKDGAQQGADITRASTTVQSVNLQSGGNNATATNTYAGIIRAIGAGGTLSGTDNANLYTRMRTYMTAVGIGGN